MQHVTTAQLDDALDHLKQAPSGSGTVEMLVRRPAEDQRETIMSGRLTLEEGMVGDNWAERGETPNYEAQVTIMSSRYVGLIAGGRDRWPLAGDQIYVDFDISVDNLPAGTRVAVGGAIVEVSASPHTGCAKFRERFGPDALRFANSDVGTRLRLRGVNTRVIEPGPVAPGDRIEKV